MIAYPDPVRCTWCTGLATRMAHIAWDDTTTSWLPICLAHLPDDSRTVQLLHPGGIAPVDTHDRG